MSALAEEEEDADTPARDHWSLLSQGAEARVYGLDLCGLPAVAKHRHRKAYRIAALDGRLRRDRTLAEARALAGARRRAPLRVRHAVGRAGRADGEEPQEREGRQRADALVAVERAAQEDLRAGHPSRNMREDGILVCQALGHGDANKRRLINRTLRRAASICAAASQLQPSAS